MVYIYTDLPKCEVKRDVFFFSVSVVFLYWSWNITVTYWALGYVLSIPLKVNYLGSSLLLFFKKSVRATERLSVWQYAKWQSAKSLVTGEKSHTWDLECSFCMLLSSVGCPFDGTVHTVYKKGWFTINGMHSNVRHLEHIDFYFQFDECLQALCNSIWKSLERTVEIWRGYFPQDLKHLIVFLCADQLNIPPAL